MGKTSRNEVLEIAISKCRMSGKLWCGYLTPSEYNKLYRIGLVCSNEMSDLVTRVDLKIGIGQPRWIYFNPKKKLRELLERKFNDETRQNIS
jgi:hypothetical protein